MSLVDVKVRRVALDDSGEIEAVIDFVNEHFLPNEPLSQCVHLGQKGFRMPWFDRSLRAYLLQNLSLVAMLNESIVGVAILHHVNKEFLEDNNNDDVDSGPNWSRRAHSLSQIYEILDAVTAKAGDMAEKFGVEFWAELFIVAVDKSRSIGGLGTLMVEETLTHLSKLEIKLCVSCATSSFSKRIFDKFDFVDLAHINFDEFVTSQGLKPFSTQGPHTKVCFVAKYID